MDEPTANQTIAENVAKAWFQCLTDTAQVMISDHDLSALTSMIEGALGGDLDFLMAVAARAADGEVVP